MILSRWRLFGIRYTEAMREGADPADRRQPNHKAVMMSQRFFRQAQSDLRIAEVLVRTGGLLQSRRMCLSSDRKGSEGPGVGGWAEGNRQA